MKSEDKPQWREAAEEEYEKMEKYKVLKPVPINEVDKNASVLSSKWVMKRKANGSHHAHITATEYEKLMESIMMNSQSLLQWLMT